jgi:2-polyprenyl-3-methyl-5-hydroxy-6-metoxy-1,4-benzoquinol methylase
MKQIDLIKTKWGFYQYAPLPSSEEMEEYYSRRYYQEGLGSYATHYDEEEIMWWRVRAELIAAAVGELFADPGASFLDVGCGEGWMLDAMHKRGYKVQGFDFSRAGIAKWHEYLLPYFIQGNIYNLLEQHFKSDERYDVIFLGNVLEHVVNPEELLRKIKQLLSPQGILIIVVPNDFSDLQLHLLEINAAMQPWWLAYPEHLSYFNSDSMKNLLEDVGFILHKIVGDFPGEFNLFSDLTNYVQDRSAGPQIHRRRMRIDNYLFGIDSRKLLDIYTILGSMGVGRNLIYYCSLADKHKRILL